ncbi:MAG: SGNH/GDSL hydrolase family protein [Alphaproteobacteria bacterium]|nr:SGNH/GDSL hydrolase family protein [Alphaproteobacteria bacterium]
MPSNTPIAPEEKNDNEAPSQGWVANSILLGVISIGIIGILELYVHVFVDDGMQYDLEMWKYAREIKKVAENPNIGHDHRPNAEALLMGTMVTTNSLGFRDRELDASPSAKTIRIASVGDSLTFGWGVPQDQTFSRILETELRSRGRDVEVINTGVGNYNSKMQAAAFFEKVVPLKPDVVLLNYFINDAEQTPTYETSFIERNSKAWTFFAARLDIAERQLGFGSNEDWLTYYRGLYDSQTNPSGWEDASAAILSIAEWCKENEVPLLISHFPELRQLDPYPFVDVESKIEALADRANAPYIDLLSAVQSEEPASLWVTVPDPHPNTKANRLFGKALADWIDEQPNLLVGEQIGQSN